MTSEQDEYLEDPGTEAPVPEVDDPLDALDDDTRARVEADRAAAVEAARAEERAATEHKFRSGMGKWGRTAQILGAAGCPVDENGDVPGLAELIARSQGTPPANRPKPADDLGPPPDPSYEPDEFNAWLKKRDVLVTAPLESRLSQLEVSLSRQSARQETPSYVEQVRPFLEGIGQAALADTPEFQANFRGFLEGMTEEQREDPENLDLAASMALAVTSRQSRTASANGAAVPTRTPAAAPQRNPQAAATAAARASLPQHQAGRTGRVPQADSALPAAYAPVYRAVQQAGVAMSDSEFALLMDENPEAYRAHRERQRQAQQRGAR